MKINSVRVIKGNEVEFSCSKGTGIGTWYYNVEIGDYKIEVGKEYGVEFDIFPQILKIGEHVRRTSDRTHFIRHHNNVNEIQGVVDGVDDDGIIYFRLSIDCLIMIEIESEDDQIKEGDWLLLTIGSDDLQLTPIGI